MTEVTEERIIQYLKDAIKKDDRLLIMNVNFLSQMLCDYMIVKQELMAMKEGLTVEQSVKLSGYANRLLLIRDYMDHMVLIIEEGLDYPVENKPK